METSSLCRICLAADVRMQSIVAGELREMYESLSMTPLETQDNRPTQACYICFSRLKTCYQLRESCMRSEQLLMEMMSGGVFNEKKLLEHSSSKQLQIRPVEHTNIDHEAQHVADSNRGVDYAYNMYPEVKLEPADTEVFEEDQLVDDRVYSVDAVEVLVKKEPSVSNAGVDISIKTESTKQSSALQSSYNTCVIKIEGLEECDNNEAMVNDYFLESSQAIDSNRAHISEKPHQCDVCNQYFSKNSDLNAHICIYSDKTMYPCHLCNKSFHRNCELTRHMLVHTGEKPYQCHICKKSCSRKDGLVTHLRTHNADKVKCNVCKKWFPNKKQFHVHKCCELAEKSYQCDVCQKCFVRKDHLKTHSRTHTGEKPFQCYKCKKRFNQKAHLNTHVRTHQWRRAEMIKSESEGS